ncbi:MAG: bifunctional isocitrate dehydrogenase kinase/phosphatase [Candidatus Zixiibacteriota bacterium]
MGQDVTSLANILAVLIRDTFDGYCDEFLRITCRARARFERRDWIGEQGRHKDAIRRLELYEAYLQKVSPRILKMLGEQLHDKSVWKAAKKKYLSLFQRRHDIELAETFFNSVTRKVLQTVGVDREIEFFYLEPINRPIKCAEPVYITYPRDTDTRQIIRQILLDLKFKPPFEDLERDVQAVAEEVDLYLWPIAGNNRLDSIDVVRAPFFRNKVAYIVGRINVSDAVIPFVLPLYNVETGIYVDTVLLSVQDVSRVFGFAHSYFHVEVARHDTLIDFLRSILPEKPVAELYISIGYNKHGKTEFYRDLHHFVHESREQFIIAPGKEGAVMLVFTLPDYNFVFKVIKDRPCFLRSDAITNKQSSREEVMSRYELVRGRDRVGRMVDTQDFENLRFRTRRFSRQLLNEFNQAARETVSIDEEFVVIKHLYLQRKVIPLPMYFEQEKDPEAIRHILVDFGYFLKDLTAAGIFPCDLFNIWNYGVTRRRRVVLFDYDDVEPLEQVNFYEKPEPRNDIEILQPEEDRITAMPDDFFVDEMERYSGIPQALKGTFKRVHADLFTVEYWQDMKARMRRGEIIDITPYNLNRRFIRKTQELSPKK